MEPSNKYEKMKKGDWIICVTNRFDKFTKGKKYQLLRDANGTVLEVMGDSGDIETPVKYGVYRKKGFDDVKKIIYETLEVEHYFKSVQEQREDIINKILE